MGAASTGAWAGTWRRRSSRPTTTRVGDLPFYFLAHVLAVAAARRVLDGALDGGRGVLPAADPRAALSARARARRNIAWIVLGTAIGVTGAMGQATIGSTMNEWPLVRVPDGRALARVRAAIEGERIAVAPSRRGFLIGCAIGLKLTYAIFALGFLVALPRVRDGRAKRVARRVARSSRWAGLPRRATAWALDLWQEFGNPVLPLLQPHLPLALVRSPSASFDRNCGSARRCGSAIFFPLYFSHQSLLVSRGRRFATTGCAAARWCSSRGRRGATTCAQRPPRPFDPPAWRFLAVFTLASYLAWLKLFGIYRYLVPLEMLSGAADRGLRAVSRARHGGSLRRRVAILAVAADRHDAAAPTGAASPSASATSRSRRRISRRTRS